MADRIQGNCENCWVWAGTGVLEIALDVQGGIRKRLSEQYLNSCRTPYACCGGWLTDFTNFYSSVGRAILWDNTNASWQDGGQRCGDGSTVTCGSISTSPNYPISSLTVQNIQTHGVSQETAINNIKNVLHQERGIWFAFVMPTAGDVQNFGNFWGNQTEADTWQPNSLCGSTYQEDGGAAHAVLCVGYNDDDPNNRYWIMLNSWGQAAWRPNGTFHMSMDMDSMVANIGMVQGGITVSYGKLWMSLSTLLFPP